MDIEDYAGHSSTIFRNENIIRQENDHNNHTSSENEPLISEFVSSRFTQLKKFPYTLVMKVSASEPRDVLQSERTCLVFIRFATSLCFTALGIVLNFRLDSSGTKGTKKPNSTFSTSVSYILLGLAFLTLALSMINYLVTVKRYANHKIKTYSFNNFSTVICMTCIIVALMGISVSLIVEEYIAV